MAVNPLTTLDTDVSYISKLDDFPPDDMTVGQLKGMFDQGANDIKGFINDTLIPEQDAINASTVTHDEAEQFITDMTVLKDNAEDSANAAATSAIAASTSASTATTKASEAASSAGTASTKATEAGTSATAAADSASAAATAAANASNSASTATTKASEAATSATNAANSAAGVVTAEAARVTAENGRVSAENSRVSAESARASAESSRASAESTRATAETNRGSAEASRTSAESSRVSAESARASAEVTRIGNENSRVSAEATRSQHETNRGVAEEARASAETARAANNTALSLWETYNPSHSYVPLNKVAYQGRGYVNISACLGALPTDTSKWLMICDKGADGANGNDGNDGISAYVHIKYSDAQPDSDDDMHDTPDKWMGIYSGTSATAPTAYTSYVWYDRSLGVDMSNYLAKDNTTEFMPTADYHPATKKYVDDSVANIPTDDKLTADVTYYVATTGSDNTGDGTEGNPFATIQHTIDIIPKNLNGHRAFVNIGDGTYYEDVNISGFFNGSLSVTSTSGISSNVIISGESSCFVITGIGSSKTVLSKLTLSDAYIGVEAYSNCELKDLVFNNHNADENAMSVYLESTLSAYIQGCSGTNNSIAYYLFGGATLFVGNGNSISAAYPNVIDSCGLIVPAGGIDLTV